MLMQFLRRTTAGLALVGAVLVAPSQARADVILQFSINGGAFLAGCSALSVCMVPNFSVGGGQVQVASVAGNAPGTPTLADLLSATLSITNTSLSLLTFAIRVGGNGYLAPTGSTTLLSHIGGTVVTGGTGSLLSYFSCVSQTNIADACAAPTFSTPALSPSIVSPGSFDATNSALIAGLTGPYSIGEQVAFTLAPGATLNYAASSQLSPTSAPEPGSIALLATGLFGAAGFMRRRKRNV